MVEWNPLKRIQGMPCTYLIHHFLTRTVDVSCICLLAEMMNCGFLCPSLCPSVLEEASTDLKAFCLEKALGDLVSAFLQEAQKTEAVCLLQSQITTKSICSYCVINLSNILLLKCSKD